MDVRLDHCVIHVSDRSRDPDGSLLEFMSYD
jgi:hypothetical protein